MDLFISTYTNKVDKKGRVSVPASFRQVLAKKGSASSVIAYSSFVKGCVEASGLDHFEKIYQSIEALDQFSDERDALSASIFGNSLELSLDADGRILLPRDLMEQVGIEDKAVFMGKGGTFEIWSPERYAVYLEEARALAKEKRASLSGIRVEKTTCQGGDA